MSRSYQKEKSFSLAQEKPFLRLNHFTLSPFLVSEICLYECLGISVVTRERAFLHLSIYFKLTKAQIQFNLIFNVNVP